MTGRLKLGESRAAPPSVSSRLCRLLSSARSVWAAVRSPRRLLPAGCWSPPPQLSGSATHRNGTGSTAARRLGPTAEVAPGRSAAGRWRLTAQRVGS